MKYYDDCPCGYPTVEMKIKNQIDLMKLQSLVENLMMKQIEIKNRITNLGV